MVRWIPLGVMAGIGLVAGSAACGSATSASRPEPVGACSLLTRAEAAGIFPLGRSYRPQDHPPVQEQTSCVYPGSTNSAFVITNVTWSKARLSNFEKAHDGKHAVEGGTLPSGESVPAPTFTKVTVDGHPAFWSARQPLPLSGTSTYPSLLAATEHGYVVAISASGLTQSQNERILSAMLGNL